MFRLIVFLLFYAVHLAVFAQEPANNLQNRPKPAVKQLLQLTSEEQTWLEEHNNVRIAYDGNLPPYSFINDTGQVDGIAVEIVTLLSKRLGINFKIFPESNWDSIYKAAANRKVDVVATMVNRPERSDWFSFTKPYLTKSLVIVTRQDNHLIKSRQDLNNKTIAVVEGYQYGEQIGNEFPGAKRVKVPAMLDSLNLIQAGKADAAVLFLGTANFLQAKHKLENLKIAGFYDRNSANESIAVRKDWPMLVTILQRGLDSLSEQEVQHIFAKWVVGSMPQITGEPEQVNVSAIAPVLPKTVVEIEQKPLTVTTNSDKVVKHISEEDVKVLYLAILALALAAGFLVWLVLLRQQKKIRSKPKNEMLMSARNLQSEQNDTMHLTIDRPSDPLNEGEVAVFTPDITNAFIKGETEAIHFQQDCSGHFNYVSPSVNNLLGYSEAEFSSNFRNFLSDNPINRHLDDYLDACIQGRPGVPYELEIYDAGHVLRQLEVTITPVYNGQGHCTGVDGIIREITGQTIAGHKVQDLPETKVVSVAQESSNAFAEQTQKAIAEADKISRTFALIYLSLERMRTMDGSEILESASEVWQEAGKRLRSALRDSDTVLELQQDKYALIMPETGAETAALVVEKIRKILQIPYLVGVQSIVMDANLGVAIYPANGVNPEELLESALALAEQHDDITAQNPVTEKFELAYEGEGDGKADNLELMQELVMALDECKLALRASNLNNVNALRRHSQLSIHFHSIHRLADFKINAFEALIRWRHPEQGVLEPNDFMALVKEIGLLDVMTYWIVQKVCLQAVVWESQGVKPEKIFINLGDIPGQQSYDVDKLIAIIIETGAKPDWLVFSINEKEFAQKSYFILPMVEKLVKAGASVSIDNFAADNDVLSLLKTMPTQFVEIDPALIRQLPNNIENAELVQDSIARLHELGKTVIAKAVNNEQQLEFLKSNGCDMIQGHLLSRAVPAEEAKELMKNLPNLAWFFEQA
jgi:PAS domain S-box-containing protein